MEAGKALQDNIINLNATLAAVIKAQDVKNQQYESFLLSMTRSMESMAIPRTITNEKGSNSPVKTKKSKPPKLGVNRSVKKAVSNKRMKPQHNESDYESDCDSEASQERDIHYYQDLIKA